MATVSRRMSVLSTASESTATSGHGDVSSQKGQVGVGQVDRWWPAIIPGVVFRCCQPGSDWSSTQSRRIHRLLLITLPSIPLLVAAVVAVVFLQNRYDILSSTQVAYLCLGDVNEGFSYMI